MTARTYSAVIDKASSALAKVHSVVLDASFVRHADRQAAARLAQKVAAVGVNVIFLECACPREVALQRLAQRWQNRIAREQLQDLAGDETALLASDGRPALYDAQCAAWQAFDPAQEAGMTHFAIDPPPGRQHRTGTRDITRTPSRLLVMNFYLLAALSPRPGRQSE